MITNKCSHIKIDVIQIFFISHNDKTSYESVSAYGKFSMTLFLYYQNYLLFEEKEKRLKVSLIVLCKPDIDALQISEAYI